jgi:drug/metabolite transporter (DMT)-like permease
MPVTLSLAAAAAAYTLLALGLVLMKKGIGWIGHKGPKDRGFRTSLAVWLSGFLLSNLYVVPAAAALGTLSPHVVASFAGWGVAVMVVLAAWVLGERLFASDLAFTALIAAAIVLLNIYEGADAGNVPRSAPFATVAILPFLALLPAFTKSARPRLKALLFAAVSGALAGLIVVTMKVLVRLHGFQIVRYPGSLYFYLYLLFSVAAFLALQLAFKRAGLMRVGPVQYSASIVYPVLGSLLVFGARLHPVQWAALACLILAVAGILRRR